MKRERSCGVPFFIFQSFSPFFVARREPGYKIILVDIDGCNAIEFHPCFACSVWHNDLGCSMTNNMIHSHAVVSMQELQCAEKCVSSTKRMAKENNLDVWFVSNSRFRDSLDLLCYLIAGEMECRVHHVFAADSAEGDGDGWKVLIKTLFKWTGNFIISHHLQYPEVLESLKMGNANE